MLQPECSELPGQAPSPIIFPFVVHFAHPGTAGRGHVPLTWWEEHFFGGRLHQEWIVLGLLGGLVGETSKS